MNLKFQKKQAGMSIVEVIVSILLIVILFSLLVMEYRVLLISKSQKYQNIAYHVANKEMEDLRSTVLSGLQASGTISDPLLSQLPSGDGNYTVDDSADYSGLKELTVTVTWNDGVSKSVVLKTLASSAGLNSQ